MKKFFRLVLIMSLMICLIMLSGCSGVTDRFWEATGWFSGDGDRDVNLNKRVVITPFGYGKTSLAPYARSLQNAVEDSFKIQSQYTIRSFRDLQKASIEFGATELVLENRYLTGARYLGVNMVVLGQISSLIVDYSLQGWYGFRTSVPQLIMEGQMRLVDTISGTVVGYHNFREAVNIDDVVAQGILTGQEPDQEFIDLLIAGVIENNSGWPLEESRKVPWSGVVLKVEGNNALISVGRDTGFNIGDNLVLHTRSTPLQSGGGHVVYMLGQPIGTLTITEMMEDNSWASVTFNQPEEETISEVDEDDESALVFTLDTPEDDIYILEPGQLVMTK